MKTIWTSIGGTFVLCCLAAFLFTAEAGMQNNNFWTEAAQGGMAEVAMGNLAAQKAQMAEVKQFGQQMVTDHTAANDELMKLAAGKNVTLPTAMSEKHQEAMAKLNGMSGMEFDREYMKMQVKDHEKMVKLFQRESERGTDADSKAFAAKTLPTLQNHLTMARTMYDGMKNMGRGDSSNNNSRRDDDSSNNNRSNNRNSNRSNNSNGNSNNSNVNNTMMNHF